MDVTALTLLAPADMGRRLADRARTLRLLAGLTRATLAARAGVSLGSLKRFEVTGKGSLDLLLKVAHALDRLGEFDTLLHPPAARSIEELERQALKPPPRRGRL